MSEKRKISVRKVLQFIVTIIVVTGCVVAVMSASRRQEDKHVKAVDIRIRNEHSCRFLDREEVKQLLLIRRHIDPMNMPVGDIDVRQMEAIAKSNPWVDAAEVFVDNAAVLHVNLTQRVPVVRVFSTDGSSYYLDSARQELPLSDRYSHYVSVVTGVPQLRKDSFGNSIRAQILAVSSFIGKDTFWNAQIGEISMNADREFELVPVLGKHRILIGDTSRLADKFSNLFAFYRKVLNRIGWDKYEVLDLRFNGQVLASPALAWKVPVDRALSNMNWVKSIVGEDVKEVPPGLNLTPKPAVVSPTVVASPKPAVAAPAATVVKSNNPVQAKPAAAVPTKTIVKSNNTNPVKPAPKPATARKLPVQAKPVKKEVPRQTTAKKPAATSKPANTAKPVQKKPVKEKEKTEQPRKPKYIYQDNH